MTQLRSNEMFGKTRRRGEQSVIGDERDPTDFAVMVAHELQVRDQAGKACPPRKLRGLNKQPFEFAMALDVRVNDFGDPGTDRSIG